MKIQYCSDLHLEFPENKDYLKNYRFMKPVKQELPDEAIFKSMGVVGIDSNKLFEKLIKSFELRKMIGNKISFENELD